MAYRKACKRCSSNKVKCDKNDPCSKCLKAGKQCVYEFNLLWREDAEQRGIAFGRENVWTKTSKKKLSTTVGYDTYMIPIQGKPLRFVNFNVDNIDSITKEDEPIDVSSPQSTTTTLSLVKEPSWLSPLETYSDYDNLLFEYYVGQILPKCTLYDDESNGFRYVILPMASSSPVLLQTVLAVSSFAYSQSNPIFEDITNLHKQSVLEGLSVLIKRQDIGSQLEILAIVMMLCIFELKNGCSPDWILHLKAAIVYCENRFHKNSDEDALAAFAKKYFAYQLFNYSSISNGESNLRIDNTWLDFSNGDYQEIDGHLGCSTEILKLVARMSHYLYLNHQGHVQMDELEDIGSLYQQKLLNLTQKSKHIPIVARGSLNIWSQLSKLDQPTAYDREIILILSAECRRLAALIYLYSAFFNHPFDSETIQPLVKNICQYLEHIGSIDIKNKPQWGMASLIWPTFIAGLHAKDFHDILSITNFLISSKDQSCLGNVAQTLDVLENVWSDRSDFINMNSNHYKIVGDEKYLDPIRWRISLG